MAPVVDALGQCHALRQTVLLTGQHQDLDRFFPGQATCRLDLPDLAAFEYEEQREALYAATRRFLAELRPDLVLVHGDTTSALAGALAAADLGLPIGHVEAGLRSHDLAHPWPEEGHRIAIDAMAALLFAPTQLAIANLAAEPAVRGHVHVTGNSGIDALFRACEGPPAPLPDNRRKRILVTSHRRENRGAAYADLCGGLRRLVAELPVEILYLLHTNPHLQAAAREELDGIPHLQLHPAVSHHDAVALLRSSWALVTDSGGMQEDGAALGIPVLVLRGVTEREEAPENIRLCGTDGDALVEQINDLLMSQTLYARMSVPSLAFGDGRAGQRIAALVEAWLASGGMQPAAGPAVDGDQQDRKI